MAEGLTNYAYKQFDKLNTCTCHILYKEPYIRDEMRSDSKRGYLPI